MSDHSEPKWIAGDLKEGHKCASCLAASPHLRGDLLFAFSLINHTDLSETEMISYQQSSRARFHLFSCARFVLPMTFIPIRGRQI